MNEYEEYMLNSIIDENNNPEESLIREQEEEAIDNGWYEEYLAA